MSDKFDEEEVLLQKASDDLEAAKTMLRSRKKIFWIIAVGLSILIAVFIIKNYFLIISALANVTFISKALMLFLSSGPGR